MNTNPIEKILYGSWRPWVDTGPEALAVKEREESPLTSKELYSGVQTPAAYDRHSLVYKQVIKRGLNQMHVRTLEEVDCLDSDVDKQFMIVSYIKEVESLLQDIPEIKEKLAASENKQNRKLTEFVLEDISLGTANIMLDTSLRYGELVPKHTYEAPQVFLDLLNRKLPEPSPFYRTSTWCAKEISAKLQNIAEGDLPVKSVVNILRELGLQLKEQDLTSEIWLEMNDIKKHAENGLFLIKWEASFLERNPERIADADFCREWVLETKKNIVEMMTGEDLLDEMVRLNEIRLEMMNMLQPLNELFEDGPKSVARLWLEELQSAGSSEEHVPFEGVSESKAVGSDSGVMSFFDLFRSCFVNKKEVSNAMNVHVKTVDNYLEDYDLKTLNFKSKTWYLRDELERLLEEKIGQEL